MVVSALILQSKVTLDSGVQANPTVSDSVTANIDCLNKLFGGYQM